MTSIDVRDLTKEYGTRRAVDDLTFTVPPGRVTGFLGPNGAGKSTTMRLVLGLDHPTSGAAALGGRPYESLREPLRTVGALLDPGAALGSRTGRDHLRILAATHRIPDRRVAEVLEETGLAPAARRRVRTYSLGMRQRLGIAAALLGDPEVVMLDEPSNGLDPEGIVWIRGLLRRLADEGRTVLVSSHLMNETASFADHLVVLGRGRLLADTPCGSSSTRAYGPPSGSAPPTRTRWRTFWPGTATRRCATPTATGPCPTRAWTTSGASPRPKGCRSSNSPPPRAPWSRPTWT
ncbi:ABC transporter ATP-binding protein [Streptomyces sp. I4(2020)]|nr:ABC transporter ATP-binding protein [Streptomyces sp. I4(2020)]